MRYLCLCYDGDDGAAASPLQRLDALAEEQAVVRHELRAGGQLLATASLEPAAQATTVSIRNGSLALEPGGTAAAADRLAALFMIEARDFNDALRLAAQLPAARTGSVAVWPIHSVELLADRSNP